ncbi:MAG: hypothetical protein WCW67_05040 [Candidatus Margulisiibacteriota bacterium]|jgi:hypothetical protein
MRIYDGSPRSSPSCRPGAKTAFWQLVRDRGIDIRGNKILLNGLMIPAEHFESIAGRLTAGLLVVSHHLRFDQLLELVEDPIKFSHHLWSGQNKIELLSSQEIERRIGERFSTASVEKALTDWSEHRLAVSPAGETDLLRGHLARIISDLAAGGRGGTWETFKKLLEIAAEFERDQVRFAIINELENCDPEWGAEAIETFRQRYPAVIDYHLAAYNFYLRFGNCDRALEACRAAAALGLSAVSNAKMAADAGELALAKKDYKTAIAAFEHARAVAEVKAKPELAKKIKKTEQAFSQAKKNEADERKFKIGRLFRGAANDQAMVAELVELVRWHQDEFDALIGKNPLKSALDLEDAITAFINLEAAAVNQGEGTIAEYFWQINNRLFGILFESAATKKEIPVTSVRIATKLFDDDLVHTIEEDLLAKIEANLGSPNPNQRFLCRVILWHVYYKQAEKAFESENLDLAVDRLLAARRIAPDNRRVAFALANIQCDKAARLLEKRDDAGSLAEIQRGLTFSKKALSTWLQYGIHAIYEEKIDQALRFADLAGRIVLPLDIKPADKTRWFCSVSSFHGLALLEKYLATGEERYLNQAEERVTAALALDPTEPTTPLNQARNKLWRGDNTALLPAINDYLAQSTHPEIMLLVRIVKDVFHVIKEGDESETLPAVLKRLSDYIVGSRGNDNYEKAIAYLRAYCEVYEVPLEMVGLTPART